MREWVIGLIGLAIVGAVATRAAPRLAGRLAPIRVGLLHSRTGPMKISEESMVEAEVLALEEINARGGLLGGRLVESSGKTVRPIPFPHSRPRSRWGELLDELYQGWDGWANPGPAGPVSKPATTPSATPAGARGSGAGTEPGGSRRAAPPRIADRMRRDPS